LRGRTDVTAFGRRVPETAQRQALAVAVLAFGAVGAATLALLVLSQFGLSAVLFETISAFSTTGLSTGITGALPTSGEAILVALMYLGRVGPLTLGVALALRERPQLYRVPEERPIIG
jgi:Trk-type K+ transport system membrane component